MRTTAAWVLRNARAAIDGGELHDARLILISFLREHPRHSEARTLMERVESALAKERTVEEGTPPPLPASDVEDAMLAEAEEAEHCGALGFTCRLLVQATMPHGRTSVSSFSRSNGRITVRMLAYPEVGLPYGHYPRILLAWITTEAVRTKSARLELGDSLSAFMRELGLVPTGGRWGSVTRLRDHMRRLFSATVSWTYDGVGQWTDIGVRPIEVAQLWWDPVRPEQATLWGSFIELNQRFFIELVDRPVPIDMGVLHALAKTRSPLAIDIYMWLGYRLSYLRRDTVIPWGALQLQFGGDYKRTVDFRRRFTDRLAEVLKHYPAARVEALGRGLKLQPSPTHVRQLRSRN